MVAKGLVIVVVLAAAPGAVPVQVAVLQQDDAEAQTTSCWCPSQSCKDFFDRPYTLNGCVAACAGIARCMCGTCAGGSSSLCTCDPG
jgi:hypothetical protein